MARESRKPYIKAKNGARVPMMRVIEMGERDKEKVLALKKKEEYDLARSEESLEALIREE